MTAKDNPDFGKIPECEHCGEPMRLNAAVSGNLMKQYICACDGEIHFVNVHKGQRGREDRT